MGSPVNRLESVGSCGPPQPQRVYNWPIQGLEGSSWLAVVAFQVSAAFLFRNNLHNRLSPTGSSYTRLA